MIGWLIGVALAGTPDGERFTHIADAASQIGEALEDFGCKKPRPYRDRAIARLERADELPWPVVELSYSRILPLFESDECTKDALEPPEDATAYRIPEVPECAMEAAGEEIATAGWLADRGYEDAANAVAELATRWDQTRCPRRRAEARRDAWVPQGSEDPKWCTCGGKRARPEDVWFGYGASADELRFELDVMSDCEPKAAYGECPVGCIATDWYRPRRLSRRGGRLHNDMIEAHGRAIEVVHDASVSVGRPRLNTWVDALPDDCHGTIEWLGEWVPYDEYSTCLIDVVAPTGWTPRGWVIVDA